MSIHALLLAGMVSRVERRLRLRMRPAKARSTTHHPGRRPKLLCPSGSTRYPLQRVPVEGSLGPEPTTRT